MPMDDSDYLMVERIALQTGVESPFWDGESLLRGGCVEPWYRKPVSSRRLRMFLKRYGGACRQGAGERNRAARLREELLRALGIPSDGEPDGIGALYALRAESVAMTVAFFATCCAIADITAITGLGEAEAAERIRLTWEGDVVGRIYGLAHAARHDGLPEAFASSDDLDEPWDDWTCPCRG